MHCQPKPVLATLAAAAMLVLAMPASAYTIYEDLPTNASLQVSHHAVGGPVLVDDFAPATWGKVTKVEWWGTATQDTRWELAFHTNNNGHPNIDSVVSGALVKFGEFGELNASGVQVAGQPDLYHYSVDISGPVLYAGTPYWFTVANFSDGWTWADALNGPTVGTESFNAHRSVGSAPCLDGGPHCGAWTDVHTDFAFRINAIPEPSTYALTGVSLLLVALWRRRQASSKRGGSAG